MPKAKTLDIPRLLEVLEPTFMAYRIGGFSFTYESGTSTLRFYVSPNRVKYDMTKLAKWGVHFFTIVVAARFKINKWRKTIFNVGYDRCGGITSEFTHRARCYSYEDIPDLFCKAMELWKSGE